MFHLVQSNFIQVLDARNEKNKIIQNKNKKKIEDNRRKAEQQKA